jgi:RNA polymerase sigma-70 factor (ECF subfamily)
MHNEYQASRRQIRGGDFRHVSLDFDEGSSQFNALPAETMTAERLYERSWALLLLDRVRAQLQDEMKAAGQAERFQALKLTLAGVEAEDYDAIAKKLGTSEAAARQAASRLRKRYRQLLLDEVQATVADPKDAADEIRCLFVALAPA